MFIVGVVFVAIGSVISCFPDIRIAFYLFLGLAASMFVEVASWLDARWTRKIFDDLEEKALADAAARLGETPDEVRSHVPQKRSNQSLEPTAGRRLYLVSS